MLFYSFEFLYLFLPVAVIGYYAVGKQSRRLAVVWVFVSSLIFYGWWNPAYVVFLLSSVIFNYFIGISLRGLQNRWVLIFGICVNLGLIGYFKYAGFLVTIFGDLTGQPFHIDPIVLPLGISFFTFQQIAWLIDNHLGKIETEDKGIWEYGQFVTFFPQLIAGPIVHHSEMMPQFHKDHNRFVNWQNVAAGISMFVIGLAKKVVVADMAAPYANAVFEIAVTGKSLSPQEAWLGMLAYTIQIYFDFSGYADMAIGLALMFNVVLPFNFDSPYKSASVAEFWRRWHITLGRFLRDYLYIPLGGSRRGLTRSYCNLLFTMFICGLWHGAGWTFVLWGALHGSYLVIGRLWRQYAQVRLPKILSVGLTFICVALGWVLFRAETIDQAWFIFKTLFDIPSATAPFQVENADLINSLFVIGPGLLIIFCLPNSQQLLGKALDAASTNQRVKWALPIGLPTWKTDIYWASFLVLLCLLSLYFLIDQSSVQEFIYFQF